MVQNEFWVNDQTKGQEGDKAEGNAKTEANMAEAAKNGTSRLYQSRYVRQRVAGIRTKIEMRSIHGERDHFATAK
jgi:hypothetical protein